MKRKVIWALGSYIICEEGKPEMYYIKEGKVAKKYLKKKIQEFLIWKGQIKVETVLGSHNVIN